MLVLAFASDLLHPRRLPMAKCREKQSNGHLVNEKDLQTEDPRTDPTRWRLLDERGRQTWHYLQSDEELKQWPQSIADRYFLNLPTVQPLSLLRTSLDFC